eukprot:gene23052-biopygen10311
MWDLAPLALRERGPDRLLGRTTWRGALRKQNQSLELTPNFEIAIRVWLWRWWRSLDDHKSPWSTYHIFSFPAPSTRNKIRIPRADCELSLLFLRPAVLNTMFPPLPAALTVSISWSNSTLTACGAPVGTSPAKKNDERWGECAKRPFDSRSCLLC